jgi:hypothetical protein
VVIQKLHTPWEPPTITIHFKNRFYSFALFATDFHKHRNS